MKKLLTILTTSSAVFLITAGVMIANKNSNKNLLLFNNDRERKEHKIEHGVLKEIGYYREGKDIRIQFIPYNVHTIDATLPEKITSLKNAFVGNTQQIKWNKTWDTKNITNMSGVFYGQIWINEPSIKTWDTSKVTDMSDMFNGAKNFNQDLSDWNVSKVTNMNGMFQNATDYNNGNNHLKWENKLGSVKTMKKMFKNTSFKHNLKSWKMANLVNNEEFGLDAQNQPEWKLSISPSVSSGTPRIDLPSENPKRHESDTSSSSLKEKNGNMELVSKPNFNSSNDLTQNIPLSNDELNSSPMSMLPNVKSESDISNKEKDHIKPKMTEKKEDGDSIKDSNLYKIPSAKLNLTKLNSPNAGLIAGAVLGSFTILGTTAGLGYYYRKNLKNLYLKSADKIKPSLLKSKDNIKDFYVKSIDKTKNLYFKSKNKIKDKIAKIRSKK
ncbi:BspA family leucine-rich repeat surface protein [Mycoplasma capricolum subsp. capricolum]|uniref:BspA family leucine-rich repeat surface protein n=1 Tax=Mycoplasma capricolum TaxID=2095 RepID=UPI003DA24C1B